ncbi:double-strand break repair protein MRE11, putative [Entamoeba histolytica HM-1:IMSS-B]|uniref:Double-strand break repair protein n=6 Tax=Entamoeba histolytica TaxID=5759 RepID=C4LVX7_ENTH1|nr:double-strand break repair protein MRE11, putative [Entamoeba histolytica HM-1:IMSS]EMD49499.1 doublestrand break repair protein MRE11A, putative [Entamoeba histolytica KU27]EMH73047.1 double-strand break repair protein MRE11, putative [Entamoeba histolytica HM-1:IMSS-B]EMS14459.1 double-strand break repair protein MRE11A, putative [Entamoeba histolytica HM-3:IMSS]ENY62926.1 double-strand break repair protein MRE11A, putative [Entamoeba histolytica HM-1:IMSS-A]GAT92835.1 double-strand break|eukprot:XP_656485.1 double-strand break repair protein MRE11, putative [Entamoeba histolytica HM-1:IMSS]
MSIEANTFKILICSDTHLGAGEKSHCLKDDCYLAFEEILQQANQEDVDLILHSGDFFDDQNPSKYCLTKTMELMRKYLMGKPKNSFDVAYTYEHNQEDNGFSMNQGIKYPMYVIHGNHDIPSGIEHVAGLDILQTAGLVNFIGKAEDISEIDNKTDQTILHLSPILLQKGTTRIALYGMSYKKNEEMNRLWASSQVQIDEPDGDVFKILLIHQDRILRNTLTTFPEELLKDRFNLIVFGHEHCSQVEEGTDVQIIQTGSSFPLSICEFEKAEKFIGLAHINGMKINMNKIALRNVREVFYEVVQMSQMIEGSANLEMVEHYIREEVQNFFDHVNTHSKTMLPLARIIIEYKSLGCIPNLRKMAFEFEKNIVNKGDCIKLKKKIQKREKKSNKKIVDDDLYDVFFDEDFMDEDFLARRRAAQIEAYIAEEMKLKTPKTIPLKAIEKVIEQVGNNQENDYAISTIIQCYINKNIEQAMTIIQHDHSKKMNEVIEEAFQYVETLTLDEDDYDYVERKMAEEKGKKKSTKKKVSKKTNSKKKKTQQKVVDVDEENLLSENSDDDVKEIKKPIFKKITKKNKKATKDTLILKKLKGTDQF